MKAVCMAVLFFVSIESIAQTKSVIQDMKGGWKELTVHPTFKLPNDTAYSAYKNNPDSGALVWMNKFLYQFNGKAWKAIFKDSTINK